MADKTIGELPVASSLNDDSLLVVEQQSEARSIQGRLIRSFAEHAADTFVQRAVTAANDAEAARDTTKGYMDAAKQSADEASDSADKAEQYSGKPPMIQDGNWWTWNADRQTYEDTGEPARGNLMYAAFWVDPSDGSLYMYTDDEDKGPGFRLNGSDLEVVLSAGYSA